MNSNPKVFFTKTITHSPLTNLYPIKLSWKKAVIILSEEHEKPYTIKPDSINLTLVECCKSLVEFQLERFEP